mmetsp:Transcript_14838/g.32611  ORF Transcript_14838/g.32611 Transcript_14838/m.32611 type:complete len:262 (-) Transcript_14838:29-814(-)
MIVGPQKRVHTLHLAFQVSGISRKIVLHLGHEVREAPECVRLGICQSSNVTAGHGEQEHCRNLARASEILRASPGVREHDRSHCCRDLRMLHEGLATPHGLRLGFCLCSKGGEGRCLLIIAIVGSFLPCTLHGLRGLGARHPRFQLAVCHSPLSNFLLVLRAFAFASIASCFNACWQPQQSSPQLWSQSLILAATEGQGPDGVAVASLQCCPQGLRVANPSHSLRIAECTVEGLPGCRRHRFPGPLDRYSIIQRPGEPLNG